MGLFLKMAGAILLVDAFFIALPYLKKTVGYALSFFGMVIVATILMLFLQSLPSRTLWIGTGMAMAGYIAGRIGVKYMRKRRRRAAPSSSEA